MRLHDYQIPKLIRDGSGARVAKADDGKGEVVKMATGLIINQNIIQSN